MLRDRLVVAIIGIPLAVFVIWWGGYALFVGVAAVTLIALHEYYTMIRPYRPNLLIGYLAAIGMLAATYFGGLGGLAGGVAGMMVISLLWAFHAGPGDHLTGRFSVTVLGVVWIAGGLAYLLLLRSLDHGLALLLLAVGVTWLSDTFAFLIGSAVGKHKLAPRISPNKTVEGAVGGLVGALIFAIGVQIYNPTWLPLREALIVGLAAGVAGQLGDLFESAVKRDLRVKDSGRLLAGHGGVLDRFDSLLIAGPAAYWVVWLTLRSVVGGFPL